MEAQYATVRRYEGVTNPSEAARQVKEGFVVMISTRGFASTDGSASGFQGGFCPGTTIDIELRTDKIEILPKESEDLQW